MRVVHHQRSVPVNRDKRPRQGSRRDRHVDQARTGAVTEIQAREVDKVDDEHDFRPCKVRAHEEHDKGKVEEVVQDKVAAYGGGPVDDFLFAGEEVGYVAELEDEEDDPGGEMLVAGTSVQERRRGGSLPVDIPKNRVHSKRSGIQVILVPDAAADSEAIRGRVEDIVHRDGDGEEPAEEREDLVRDDGAATVRFTAAERVI